MAADLTRFYRPRSMAIVGAHDTRSGLSGFTQQALGVARRVGARFYPVNPKLQQVYGIDCLTDCGHPQFPAGPYPRMRRAPN
jgi:acyl-CoA synthetase (NDP forming)